MLSVYVPRGTTLERGPVKPDEPLPDAAVWIDLVSPTALEDKLVEQMLGVAVPTSEEMQAIEVSSPLYVANEGKLLAMVVPEMADAVLKQMQQHRLGQDAAIICDVVEAHRGMVLMKTQIGGTRVLDVMFGEQLPRIC